MKNASSVAAVPEVFGNYNVVEKLAEGGMSSVFKAVHRQTGQFVAIKVLHKDIARQPVLRKRFEQEFSATRELDHPNIVRSLEFGIQDAFPYLVMEYVDGKSLGDILEKRGPLPEGEAIRLISQVADGLNVAHEKHLIHRDIKPDNILVTKSGQAKLTDLGLAKNQQSEQDLTKSQSCFGTLNFMAPEQFEDAKRADFLCDLYSLGATLYQAVTGELPFRTRSLGNIASIYKKKRENDIQPPRKLVPKLSSHVDFAIRRAIRANRHERFPSLRDFIAALEGRESAAAAPAASLVPPPPPVSKSTKGAERRVAIRHASNFETSCLPIEKRRNNGWSGRAVNISASGICLSVVRRFEVGTVLTVDIKGRDSRLAHSFLLRVAWVKKSGELWHIGCAFDRKLSDIELRELR
jgi:serine/threonine protein kinase